jgi:hypothetical protein
MKAVKLKLAVTVTTSIKESPEIIQEVPYFDRIIHEVEMDRERGLSVRQRLGLLSFHINRYYQIIPHRKSKELNVRCNLNGSELNSGLCNAMINTISACYSYLHFTVTCEDSLYLFIYCTLQFHFIFSHLIQICFHFTHL